jgi:hypothetical protein
MELLLNLLWLLLALPAYCLWQNARIERTRGNSSPFQCFLALGCVLVLLFPVISATDDLHAMRAEMEESSKRSLRQAVNDKSSAGQSRWHSPAATVAAFAAIVPLSHNWRELRVPSFLFTSAPFAMRAGRAPPIFGLQ